MHACPPRQPPGPVHAIDWPGVHKGVAESMGASGTDASLLRAAPVVPPQAAASNMPTKQAPHRIPPMCPMLRALANPSLPEEQ